MKKILLLTVITLSILGCKSKRRPQPVHKPVSQMPVYKPLTQESLDESHMCLIRWSESVIKNDKKLFWECCVTDFKSEEFKQNYFDAICETYKLRTELRKKFEIDIDTDEKFSHASLYNQGFDDGPWVRLSMGMDFKVKILDVPMHVYWPMCLPPANKNWGDSEEWKIGHDRIIFKYKYNDSFYDVFSPSYITFRKIGEKMKIYLHGLSHIKPDRRIKAEQENIAHLKSYIKKIKKLQKYLVGKNYETIDFKVMRALFKQPA